MLRCAAEVFIWSCRDEEAEKLLLRAAEASEHEYPMEQLAEILADLGEFYDRQGRIAELVTVWDRMEGLATHSGLRGRLENNMIARAEEAFKRRQYQASLDFVVRIERLNRGTRYGAEVVDELQEPPWIPDLYQKMGKIDRAEKIHQSRIHLARATEDPLSVARHLDHYGYFLRSEGRLDESARLLAEANSLRANRIAELVLGERECAEAGRDTPQP